MARRTQEVIGSPFSVWWGELSEQQRALVYGYSTAAIPQVQRSNARAFTKFMAKTLKPAFGRVDVRRLPKMSQVERDVIDRFVNPEWRRMEGRSGPVGRDL